jgi:hypothetical protein
MKDPNEPELTDKNRNDLFTCQDCKESKTRGLIRKIWRSIPFGKEDSKKYYCGCNGWD